MAAAGELVLPFTPTEVLTRGAAYGDSTDGADKRIVIDYSSPNMGKELAFHHLRGTMIGNSLSRVFKKRGHPVIRVNHLGDWGTSYHTRQPVLDGILDHFPKTLYLAFVAMVFATLSGVLIGIVSAVKQSTWIDGLGMSFAFLGISFPVYWVGLILILVVAAAMLTVVWFVLYRTRLGLAIRATANDLEVANLMGMNVHRVAMATVAISVALAAIAGVVVAPVFVVDPFMWLAPLVTMLAIVVLGGLGSLKGSLIGALVIGYVEAITVFALPAGAYLKGAVALLIMVVVLLARPEGLFGVAFEEER